KCLKLLNENTAVALAYGFFRRKEFDDKTPRNVAFLDLGHGSASVTIASFTQKKVKIISHNSDRNLGARSFDYTLMKKLSHEFEAKYGCNPLETPKTRLRLLEAIEKGRIMLSANQEVQINVECLMEDEDLSRHLTRDEFIVMIEPDLERLNALLEKTLAESGLTPSDIHSVEMIGEATRIPIVQDRAQDVFK
ncbi:MAG: Hsp70 family protein, partial [Anaerolineae bacterium]|nr:Hsp70 family protein [Anaerolineae bacterium]